MLIQLIANCRSLKLVDNFDVGPVVEISQPHIYNVLDGSQTLDVQFSFTSRSGVEPVRVQLSQRCWNEGVPSLPLDLSILSCRFTISIEPEYKAAKYSSSNQPNWFEDCITSSIISSNG